MKKLGIILLLLASTAAFAFGGGGSRSHRVREWYKHGVDAIGTHIDPDNPIDPPDWRDCDPDTETLIDITCCKNDLIYDNGTKCCNEEGFEVKDDVCQKACESGLVLVGDECVDLCENYTSTECKPDCDWQTGKGIPGNEGEYCENKTGKCLNGTCEPIVCDICSSLVDGECITACGINEHCQTPQGTCVCNEGFELDTDNTCTVCANGNVYLPYMEDPCGTEIENFTGCRSNKDCPANSFCEMYNFYECDYPEFGECMSSNAPDVTITGLGTVKMLYRSTSWWGAYNFCKTQKRADGSPMALINISKFKCYQSGTTTAITAGYCCIGNNQTCGDWSSYWDNSTIYPEYETKITTDYSPVIVSLRKALGCTEMDQSNCQDMEFWTTNNEGTDMREIHLELGYVVNDSCHADGYRPLCQ